MMSRLPPGLVGAFGPRGRRACRRPRPTEPLRRRRPQCLGLLPRPAPSRTGTLARSRREVVKLGLRTMVPLPWEGDRKAQERNADQRDEPAVALKVP